MWETFELKVSCYLYTQSQSLRFSQGAELQTNERSYFSCRWSWFVGFARHLISNAMLTQTLMYQRRSLKFQDLVVLMTEDMPGTFFAFDSCDDPSIQKRILDVLLWRPNGMMVVTSNLESVYSGMHSCQTPSTDKIWNGMYGIIECHKKGLGRR